MLEAALSDSGELVLYRDSALETLHRLIAGARARLADLEGVSADSWRRMFAGDDED